MQRLSSNRLNQYRSEMAASPEAVRARLGIERSAARERNYERHSGQVETADRKCLHALLGISDRGIEADALRFSQNGDDARSEGAPTTPCVQSLLDVLIATRATRAACTAIEPEETGLPARMEEFLERLAAGNANLADAPHEWLEHEGFVLGALTVEPALFSELPAALQEDPHLQLAAVEATGGQVLHAMPQPITSVDLMLEAVERDAHLLALGSEAIRDNRDVVSRAVAASRHNKGLLAFASERLRDDDVLVRTMLEYFGADLRFASDRLKSNADLVWTAMQNDPHAYVYADRSLQSREDFALFALERLPYEQLEIADELTGDPDFLRKAVRFDANVFLQAPEHIRRNTDLVVELIGVNPEVSGYADDLITATIADELIDRNPEVYKHLSTALQLDRARTERVIDEIPEMLGYAPAELREDRDLVMRAVRRDGEAYASCLHPDPEIAKIALRSDARSAILNMRRELRDRTDVRVVAAINCPDLIAERGWDPEPLLEEAVPHNPLVLDYVPAARREAYLETHPEQRSAYDDLKAKLEQLNINHPDRLVGRDVLYEIVHNRLHPRAPGDSRPLAVVVMDNYDERSFIHNSIHLLARDYRVLYYEVGRDHELTAAVAEATAEEPAAVLNIGAHGTPTRAVLSGQISTGDETRLLDVGDGEDLEVLGRAIAVGGHIVLSSCSTGKGYNLADNVSNTIARAAPQAWVHAPTFDGHNRLRLGKGGRFLSPNYVAEWKKPFHVHTVAPSRGFENAVTHSHIWRGIPIPDGDDHGVRIDFSPPSDDVTVENAVIDFVIEHPCRGDIELHLIHTDTDGAETSTKLVHFPREDAEPDLRGRIVTPFFAGHELAGTWSVRLVDRERKDRGIARSIQLELSGRPAR